MVARFAFVFVLLAAFMAPPAHAVVDLPDGFVDQEMVWGLHDPTSFAFLPDGRALVLEQFTGAIRLVVNGVAVVTPLTTIPDLVAQAERGALAIAVDSRWPTYPYVYVFHTTLDRTHRVLRYTAFGELNLRTSAALALGVRRTIIDNLPDDEFNHNGGSLRFGPDGMLYLSLGDDNKGCPAQDTGSLRGCVLRMDVRSVSPSYGGPPPRATLAPVDNPFVNSTDVDARLVWAYGFRNPFRFVIDPADGVLYVADVGVDTWEEVDAIRSGDNAGWPWREGPASFSWSGCTNPGNQTLVQPIDSYGHDDGVAVIAAGVYRKAFHSRSWPSSYDGNVFYADFFSGFVRMLRRDGNGWVRATVPGQPDPAYWATGLVDPVEFNWGPDGHLWYLSHSQGTLRRISAQSVATAPPTTPIRRLQLTAAPNPAQGPVKLECELPRAGPMRLDVYDATGRRLMTVTEGHFEAGRHVMEWSGQDAQGRTVAPGLYLAVLDVGGEKVTRRLVRSR